MGRGDVVVLSEKNAEIVNCIAKLKDTWYIVEKLF